MGKDECKKKREFGSCHKHLRQCRNGRRFRFLNKRCLPNLLSK